MDNKRIIGIIDKIIDVAFKHKGQVFGGYVRDVIVPLKLDPNNRNLQFKDVDIWFKRIEDREDFVDCLYVFLTPKKDYSSSIFSREEYTLRIDDGSVVTFDLLVCSRNPVDDSDINKISVTGKDKKNEFVFASHCDLSVNEIIDLIAKRKYILREEFINRLKMPSKSRTYNTARIENLLNRGWDVYTHNGDKLSIPLSDNWTE